MKMTNWIIEFRHLPQTSIASCKPVKGFIALQLPNRVEPTVERAAEEVKEKLRERCSAEAGDMRVEVESIRKVEQ